MDKLKSDNFASAWLWKGDVDNEKKYWILSHCSQQKIVKPKRSSNNAACSISNVFFEISTLYVRWYAMNAEKDNVMNNIPEICNWLSSTKFDKDPSTRILKLFKTPIATADFTKEYSKSALLSSNRRVHSLWFNFVFGDIKKMFPSNVESIHSSYTEPIMKLKVWITTDNKDVAQLVIGIAVNMELMIRNNNDVKFSIITPPLAIDSRNRSCMK